MPLPDGREVQVWTTRSAAAANRQPSAYVLRYCGNGERAEDAAWRERATWESLPVEIWAMNYPGFGGSSGPGTLDAIPRAALATCQELRRRSGAKPIFLSGFSLGSAVALDVAAHEHVSGLLLRNPPPIREVVTGQYGWWNLWLLAGPTAAQVPRELDSLRNARQVSAPAVFVIAGADQTVPRKYQRLVTAAYAGEKRIIVDEKADHNSSLSAKAQQKLESDLHWLFSRGVSAAGPATRPGARSAPASRP